MRLSVLAVVGGLALGLLVVPPVAAAPVAGGRDVAAATSRTKPNLVPVALNAAAKTPRIYACGAVLYRPATFPLWCWRTTMRAERLHWTQWTSTRAVAVGRQAFKTGTIVNGRHVWASYPARFALDRPRVAKGRLVWTRVTRTFTGAIPQYDKRSHTYWLSYRRSGGGTCALTWTEDKSEPLCGAF